MEACGRATGGRGKADPPTEARDERTGCLRAAAAVMTLREGEKMDLGLEDAAPRSKIDAPRGSAAATRVAAPDLHKLEL